ncbi:MAG: hypothetical protein IJV56_03435 [Neisseriaceae bacterium]|nr:hypothetical protein [Neisseriaceae bacterium]MBQ9724377.1 hypothetical protein [Neisseriaceae bacterium]MBR1818989.1 hypothetical protein [Neisseriaceae bacterium]
MLIIGLIMVALGVVGRLWIGKRAFDRTNEAGVQGFNSYKHAVAAGIMEAIIGWVSYIVALIGVIVILVSFMS